MPQSQFHKGDRVRFKIGARSVRGLVNEDRGPIGISGRHLYPIEFRADPESPSQIELPADQLEAVNGAVAAKQIGNSKLNNDARSIRRASARCEF